MTGLEGRGTRFNSHTKTIFKHIINFHSEISNDGSCNDKGRENAGT